MDPWLQELTLRMLSDQATVRRSTPAPRSSLPSWFLQERRPDPNEVMVIKYTSGTTGLPKGVLVSRRAIAADIDMLAEAERGARPARERCR